VPMAFLDDGWTEEQAQGLLDSLKLSGAVPNWKHEHLQRLYDWCRANAKNYKAIEGHLEFIAFDLCNAHEAVGMALKRANTREDARKAVEPYVRLLQR
jgi:hypothetical protein